MKKNNSNPKSNLFRGTLGLIFSASVMVAIASPAPVAGTVTLEDFSGSTFGKTVTVSIQKENSTVREDLTTMLDADGKFMVLSELRGSVDVWAKVDGWLDDDAKEKHLKLTDAGLQLTIRLDGSADIDDDDDVTILDYSHLSDHWDMGSDDPAWHDKGDDGVSAEDCDIDGDGKISILDYSKFSDNFGRRGRHKDG